MTSNSDNMPLRVATAIGCPAVALQLAVRFASVGGTHTQAGCNCSTTSSEPSFRRVTATNDCGNRSDSRRCRAARAPNNPAMSPPVAVSCDRGYSQRKDSQPATFGLAAGATAAETVSSIASTSVPRISLAGHRLDCTSTARDPARLSAGRA